MDKKLLNRQATAHHPQPTAHTTNQRAKSVFAIAHKAGGFLSDRSPYIYTRQKLPPNPTLFHPENSPFRPTKSKRPAFSYQRTRAELRFVKRLTCWGRGWP
jgi:hypothetical protein